MVGGIPQGTLCGPENFLNMIDDLHTNVDDVKFVDDVILYEVCNTHDQNKLKNGADDIQGWATENNMSLNTGKPKELMIYFGRVDLDIPRITTNGEVIERVYCAKLSRRLHLLNELKRTGLSSRT